MSNTHDNTFEAEAVPGQIITYYKSPTPSPEPEIQDPTTGNTGGAANDNDAALEDAAITYPLRRW